MEKTLEQMLVDQCAPTLAGVKPANLFRCAESAELFRSVYEWNLQLQQSGIRIRVVKRCRRTHACLIYVCRWDWLTDVLCEPATRAFLTEEGYDVGRGTDGMLCQLARRLCVQQDFPHEIGIFLGYPLRDVIGFIENNGRNYSCCGHWKCYGDAHAAQETFALFHRCTAVYQRMFRQGVPLLRMVV